MKPISDFTLKEVPKTNIRSKRAYILSQFLEELNLNNPKPYKPSYIAFRLSHLKIHDMEATFSMCMDYKRRGGVFAKCFFGSLKNK